MTEAEIQESLEKKEAQANAQILEMVSVLLRFYCYTYVTMWELVFTGRSIHL